MLQTVTFSCTNVNIIHVKYKNYDIVRTVIVLMQNLLMFELRNWMSNFLIYLQITLRKYFDSVDWYVLIKTNDGSMI